MRSSYVENGQNKSRAFRPTSSASFNAEWHLIVCLMREWVSRSELEILIWLAMLCTLLVKFIFFYLERIERIQQNFNGFSRQSKAL